MPSSSAVSSFRLPLASLSLVIFCVLLSGCEKQESIQNYTVASHESLQTPEFLKQTAAQKPRDERMLAAIIPAGAGLWFFKLQGMPEPVAAQEAVFREFLKSVHFSAPDKAEWKLPANWEERPGSGMRYATLLLPGQPPLEVSVTTFPTPNESMTESLLNNINRWRGQLSLPPINAEDLPTQSERIPSGDLIVTFVNLLGKAKPQAGGMAQMPTAPMGEGVKPQDDTEPAKMDYTKPDGWSVMPAAPLSMVTFNVTDGERSVLITISRARGSQAMNVNRWRGQVGLAPIPEDDVAKSLKKIPIGSRIGDLVELVGKDPRDEKDKAIFGLMIPDGDVTVFVKLTGDPELAVRERANFEAFAKSIRF